MRHNSVFIVSTPAKPPLLYRSTNMIFFLIAFVVIVNVVVSVVFCRAWSGHDNRKSTSILPFGLFQMLRVPYTIG